MTFTTFLRTWVLPPALVKAVRSWRLSKQFCGNYASWQDAQAASTGYDAQAIFERVRSAARAVRDGKALWERDSVLFHHEEYNYPLLTCLLHSAANHGGRLHVLDFGGALGSTYQQNRRWLEQIPDLSWTVVEQPHVVACGKEEFSDSFLFFALTIEEAFEQHPITLVLFSGVLQYLQDPYGLIKTIASHPVDIVLDRTPFAFTGERITVQKVPVSIYPASYPCRFLDQKKVTDLLRSNRSALLPWYQSAVDPEGFLGVMAQTTSTGN